MSRFSAEPWRLTLEQDAWCLAGAGGRFVAPVGNDPAAALATMGGAGTSRGGRLAVEIGDAWLRYLVIDWPLGLQGGAERRAWVAERFRAVHALNAADWVVVIDGAAVGSTALTGAAPRALVDAVTRFAVERRLRLVALQGSFVTAYNGLQRGTLQAADTACGALGLCRDGRLTIGLWARGQWRRVRSVKADFRGDLEADLDAGVVLGRTVAGWLPGLAREVEKVGQGGVLYVHGIAADAMSCMLPEGWRLQPCGGGA